MALYQNFTPEELRCRCGECGLGERDMNPRFMRRMVDLRNKLGFPFPVTSAVRCPAYNKRVSTTGATGPHTPLAVEGDPPQGHAMDVALYGEEALKLVSLALKYGMTGVGIKQRGPHDERFVHLDDLPQGEGRPRPWPWTY